MKNSFLISNFLILIGILIFLFNFLSFKNYNLEFNNDFKNPLINNSFNRLIFIIIDGLRYDFAKKYLKKTLNFSKNHFFSETYSHPPTVTLPRIKSITTGTIPIFLEIGNNLLNKFEIKSDSLIYQFSKIGNITIIGDNVWKELFKNKINFDLTKESFDIFDINSIDNLIFEKLPIELKKNNSNLIISHFLGVDHSSHVYGFNSIEVKKKIKKIN